MKGVLLLDRKKYYQINFITYILSNIFYQIHFIKYILSNTFYQIHFINPNWHELREQEKCPSLTPPKIHILGALIRLNELVRVSN